MKKITTIKISNETKTRLTKLKEHERETYDSTVRKILHILNLFRKNPEKAVKMLKNIDHVIERRAKYTKEYPEK
jgi:hypothetical protein